MWGLGSPARVEPALLALKAQSLNHWTTREVPPSSLIWISYSPSDFSYHLYQRFLSGAFGWTSQYPSALWNIRKRFSSVQSLSRAISLWSHETQHARPPCPSPTARVHPNPCPLSRWCHPTSHPLSSPSPPAFNLSQLQGLFQWVSSSHQVARVLEFQLPYQSFQWTPRTDLL